MGFLDSQQLIITDEPKDQVSRLPGARPPVPVHTASRSAKTKNQGLDHGVETCPPSGAADLPRRDRRRTLT